MEKITHLISMVDFVKHTQNQKQELGQDFDSFKLSQLGVVFRYANFLSQTLELCQFVPCDEEGNFLEEPKYYDEWVAYTNQGWEPEYDAKIMEKYHRAKQRCLFEGFEVMELALNEKSSHAILYKGIVNVYWKDSITKEWVLSKGLRCIEDLTIFKLPLSSTALNQIY